MGPCGTVTKQKHSSVGAEITCLCHACAASRSLLAPQVCLHFGVAEPSVCLARLLPKECMPLWPGGSLARCANTLSALGQLVVYTGVCEFSQTSQTRIRTNSGGNQCSNIETQGFLRERDKRNRGRTGVMALVAFTSSYLGFSVMNLVPAPGLNLDNLQESSTSRAALLLCGAGVVWSPAWWHVQMPPAESLGGEGSLQAWTWLWVRLTSTKRK